MRFCCSGSPLPSLRSFIHSELPHAAFHRSWPLSTRNCDQSLPIFWMSAWTTTQPGYKPLFLSEREVWGSEGPPSLPLLPFWHLLLGARIFWTRSSLTDWNTPPLLTSRRFAMSGSRVTSTHHLPPQWSISRICGTNHIMKQHSKGCWTLRQTLGQELDFWQFRLRSLENSWMPCLFHL